jgi:hypothetical protein
MNLVCKVCGHKWDYKGNQKRAQCGVCKERHKRCTWIKTGITSPTSPGTSPRSSPPISDDLMSGSLVKALKKAGLDPMKNGQLRDAISTILEKDEYKIAWANALEKKKIDSIRLAKRVLISWLKEEKYL